MEASGGFFGGIMKQAMKFMMHDLSDKLKKNQLKIVKTNGEEKKFKDLLNDRTR